MLKKSIAALSGLLLLMFLIHPGLKAGGPGDQVSNFTLKNYDGTSYTLNDTKDAKAIVIMFWSSECPFVQGYNDRIVDFVNEYSGKGITFWAINANSTETVQDVETHAKAHKYPFPVLKDVNNIVADNIGATRTPEVFVLSPDRTILYHGRISDNRDKEKETSLDLKNALDEILAGKEVTVKETKSFGCSIKKAQGN
jgi:peroxiredoxin